MASVLSWLRYLLADFIGEDDETPPFLPDGLREGAAPVVSEGIHRLIDYQGAGYARLYVERLRRFVGRRDVDSAMVGEIARLMAMRMSYEDPIRIAQQKLAELETGAGEVRGPSADDVRKFRFDELVGALPAIVAEPVLDVLEWLGWTHKRVSIRFSTKSRGGIRRLKIEADLRAGRPVSGGAGKEGACGRRLVASVRAIRAEPSTEAT